MLNKNFAPEPTQNGVRDGNRVIGYSGLVRQLDKGRYDKCLPEGMRMLACIFEAKQNGWLSLPIDKELLSGAGWWQRCSSQRRWKRTALLMFTGEMEALTRPLSIQANTEQSVSIPALSVSRLPTILKVAPSKNTDRNSVSNWRCACIRTWWLPTKIQASGCLRWVGKA